MVVHRGTASGRIGHHRDEEVLQKVPSLKLVDEGLSRPPVGTPLHVSLKDYALRRYL
jgi:hypothetical protein